MVVVTFEKCILYKENAKIDIITNERLMIANGIIPDSD